MSLKEKKTFSHVFGSVECDTFLESGLIDFSSPEGGVQKGNGEGVL